ncbi:MAG: M67 family metallopeptidase [Lachnospiraceae bacterium]|nr:M67 family metallopeptidase [Lachnospiraceae bacterium]
MSFNKIHINDEVLKIMVSSVEASYPAEGCGLLFKADDHAGPELKVKAAAVCFNEAKGVSEHYRMDPMEVFKHEENRAKENLSLSGIYHSHPDKPAILSEEDIREMLPGMVYIVFSVLSGKVKDIKGFIKHENVVHYAEVEVQGG